MVLDPTPCRMTQCLQLTPLAHAATIFAEVSIIGVALARIPNCHLFGHMLPVLLGALLSLLLTWRSWTAVSDRPVIKPI